jgi:RNase P subunit RPR2
MNQEALSPQLIKQGTIRTCKQCESVLFDTTTAIVKISKIMSPNGEDIEVPIRVLLCRSCGTVPEWSDPENILPKSLKKAK